MIIECFINLESILCLPSQTDEECEFLFTLWTKEETPKPISCKMTNACYKEAKLDSYINTYYYSANVEASFLAYAINRPNADSRKMSNSVLLVTRIMSIKVTSLKHSSTNSFENTNPPVVHKIYEETDHQIIQSVIEMKHCFGRSPEKILKKMNNLIRNSISQDTESLNALVDAKPQQKLLAVPMVLNITEPNSSLGALDESIKKSLERRIIQAKDTRDAESPNDNESTKRLTKRKESIETLADLAEPEITDSQSIYLGRKRRHLDSD
ncbi:hypothetical protein CLU79DRAFT_106764 [Phycomyces nitens]|nr:hypothetical protein CLU79DRAFT_106764 [Phycomyces nitens]